MERFIVKAWVAPGVQIDEQRVQSLHDALTTAEAMRLHTPTATVVVYDNDREGHVVVEDDLSAGIVAFCLRGHHGPGWYAWCAEYPDEGSFFFDREPSEDALRHVGLVVAPQGAGG